MNAKIINIVEKDWVNVKERAVPKNGAEQGVARNTEINPFQRSAVMVFLFMTGIL